MIGFFDSGIGGLTVLEPVRRALGEYDYIYLGDSARAPYGSKSHDELMMFLEQGARFLFDEGCELVIVACNSASASALKEVQDNWLVRYHPRKRILGVIKPTVEKLVQNKYRKILVLGTVATISSGAYEREFFKLSSDLEIATLACPEWGFMVERGLAGTKEMRLQVERDLQKVESGIEAILLACTHYPYVRTDVEAVMLNRFGSGIEVFEQGDLVAQSLVEYLSRHDDLEGRLKKNGNIRYFTTGDAHLVSTLAERGFGYKVTFDQLREF